jgi:oligoribonuclease NrnB/cAMP/cGMP phosphodiesterase (DHH superfamily)
MQQETVNNTIISHKNCPDGAAAVLYARLICPSVSYFFSNHIEVNELILKTAKKLSQKATFWITDICCDYDVLQEVLEILKPKQTTLRIFEHHISRQWLKDVRIQEGLDFKVVFGSSRCGSKMFYDEYVQTHPQLLPYKEFSELVNDRDLWINKDARGVLITKLHNLYEDHLFVERMLENPSLEITEKEKLLLAYQDRKEEKHLLFLLDTIQIQTDENGFKYGVIYGNGMSSEILDRALQEKELEYAMLINLNAKRGHIRSRGNFNCADFAMKKGGGGHNCAAGFPIEFDFPSI